MLYKTIPRFSCPEAGTRPPISIVPVAFPSSSNRWNPGGTITVRCDFRKTAIMIYDFPAGLALTLAYALVCQQEKLCRE